MEAMLGWEWQPERAVEVVSKLPICYRISAIDL